MTQKFKRLAPLIIVLLALSLSACQQRLPRPKTAQGALKSYFNSYGNKYEESDFGQHKVDDVEISDITELQRGMVFVEAYISLDDGEIVYKVGATLLKKTLRWKVLSWENLGKAS